MHEIEGALQHRQKKGALMQHVSTVVLHVYNEQYVHRVKAINDFA